MSLPFEMPPEFSSEIVNVARAIANKNKVEILVEPSQDQVDFDLDIGETRGPSLKSFISHPLVSALKYITQKFYKRTF